MMDFNADQPRPLPQHDRDKILAELLIRLESVLFALFPAGKVRNGTFYIGDLSGAEGESLNVALHGEKPGLWRDHATGEGGDLFKLIAACIGVNTQTDFPKVLDKGADLLGRLPQHALSPSPTRKAQPIDELGPVTAKWNYLNAQSKLIAVMYRYDPPGGKKEFRPLDVLRHKKTAPNPRPLYNQPNLINAWQVVLAEGEKCAQALIDVGVVATTAMFGANAPIDKTDWSPLRGKAVLIWPDKDQVGMDYARNAAQAILQAGAISCAILTPPADKPDSWDAADAFFEGFDITGFLAAGERTPVLRSAELNDDLFQALDPSTEDGLATAFTRHYGEDWRYCTQWGKWLVWNGQRWNQDHLHFIGHLIREICCQGALLSSNAKLKPRLTSASTTSGVEKFVRADPVHAISTSAWDAAPWLLNTPSGVVDLRSGTLREHRRSDQITRMTTASPQQECPTWRQFLLDITGGDTELMAYLQVMAGYCLTGITSEHALFFLYGTGANGKSVFVNVLATIMGDYAATAPMDAFMESVGDRHPTEMAGLQGARLVTATETEQGRRWNEARIKTITGGDKISARFMRQDFFEYSPQFKLMITGNHKPTLRNVDDAMKRRLHLIPFTVTIPLEKRDQQLTEKLLKERNGILYWAVQGALLWQQNGLQLPDKVISATADYFAEEDVVGNYLEEETQQHHQARTAISDLYQRWQEYSNKRGEFVGTIRWFTQQLINRGFERIVMAGGARGIRGLMLKARDYGERLPYKDN